MTLKIVIYKGKAWGAPTRTELNTLIPPPGKGNVVMAVMSSSEIAFLDACQSPLKPLFIFHKALVQGVQ